MYTLETNVQGGSRSGTDQESGRGPESGDDCTTERKTRNSYRPNAGRVLKTYTVRTTGIFQKGVLKVYWFRNLDKSRDEFTVSGGLSLEGTGGIGCRRE